MSEPGPVVIGGRYELQERVGAGGMAEVWLAADLRLNGKKVAVKRLLGFRADSPDAAENLERVRREAFAASRVSHAHLVSVTDFVAENDEPFIVMEYVPGKSLADAAGTAGLSPARAARVMSQVAMALADVHAAGLVHRDIKPGNILLDNRGNAKVADFGIARAKDDPRFTQTGFLTGTIAYLAPELLNGADATPASDMWSFGATLFEAIEGRRAFDGPTTPATLMAVAAAPVPRAVNAGPLSGVIDALLNRNPEQRPTAEQMADALTQIAARPGAPRPPAPAPPPQPPARFTTPPQPGYGTPPPGQAPRTFAPMPQHLTPPRPQQQPARAGRARHRRSSSPRPARSSTRHRAGSRIPGRRPPASRRPGRRTAPRRARPVRRPTRRASARPATRSWRSPRRWSCSAAAARSPPSSPRPAAGRAARAAVTPRAPSSTSSRRRCAAHDLNAYTAALCPEAKAKGALTQTQLDQFSDVQVVNEPNESNIGRLEITFDFAGNKTNDAYDVTHGRPQRLVRAGSASGGGRRREQRASELMQPADTVIRAERVIAGGSERAACVVVRGEVIADVVEHVDPGAAQVIDLPGDRVLLPGLVDSHVHVNEPGRTEWEGFATATAAAAAGGVTTIVDMPLNSIPPTVDVAALHTKQRAAAGQLAVDVAFWGGAVPGNADSLQSLHEAGVVGFKCFLLPSGVDEFPPLDPDGLAAAMRAIAEFDGLLIAHAEDEAALGAAPHGPGYAGFLASRPDAAEVRAIESAAGGDRPHRLPHAHRPRVERRDAAAHPGGEGRRPAGHRRDLPALPDAVVGGRPGRRDPVQVLPADPRRRQPGRAVGRAARRHPRLRGVRPLALPAGAQGGRRLRDGVGRHRVGAARAGRRCGRRRGGAACRSPGSSAGWPPPRPS